MLSKSLLFNRFYLLIVTLMLCMIAMANNSQSASSGEQENANILLAGLDNINGFDDEFLFLHAEQYVSIATRGEEKAGKAPSIVTVITAQEIENLGAKTLTDIMRIVPGFDIIKSATLGRVVMGSRGVRTADMKIKVLLDGHSLNNAWDGGTSFFFDDLSLKNVKKIEVIRGPGSALYGANAFLAVINVVTKDAADIDGVEVSSGFGSYDTQEYDILFGKTLYGVDITGSAAYFNTNGLSETIKEDKIAGSPISLSPGDTDDSRNKLDLNMKLAYKGLTFTGKYMNKDTEQFVGPSFILVDEGDNFFNYAMADLRYKWEIGDKLTVTPRVYYDQYDQDLLASPLPPGFSSREDLDGDGDIEQFPEGVLNHGIATNRRIGSDTQFDYNLFDNNTLTFGFSYEWERMDNIQTERNFEQTPLGLVSLGEMQRMPEEGNWIRESLRQIWAVYIQDKWDISDNLGFTIGIRHDHYSDFEGTTNPRLGFVWSFLDDFTFKALYGQAFRAPNFNELYLINSIGFIGNPDLQPETIRTYELDLHYRFTENLSFGVNYFFNVIRDELRLRVLEGQTPFFANAGGSNIQGIEFETKANLSHVWKGAYAFANYTYQDAETKGDPLPEIPRHKGNVGFNIGITKYLNANISAFISDERIRAQDDAREDSPGYALVNLTLIAKEFFNDMKIKASLNNLFDKEYDDPVRSIPTDIPRPGRTFYIELGYKF